MSAHCHWQCPPSVAGPGVRSVGPSGSATGISHRPPARAESTSSWARGAMTHDPSPTSAPFLPCAPRQSAASSRPARSWQVPSPGPAPGAPGLGLGDASKGSARWPCNAPLARTSARQAHARAYPATRVAEAGIMIWVPPVPRPAGPAGPRRPHASARRPGRGCNRGRMFQFEPPAHVTNAESRTRLKSQIRLSEVPRPTGTVPDALQLEVSLAMLATRIDVTLPFATQWHRPRKVQRVSSGTMLSSSRHP
jgi:hypothetical protein